MLRSAPVLSVALDLAQDRARSRQILDGWDSDGAARRERLTASESR
jgi:hypothetical protein